MKKKTALAAVMAMSVAGTALAAPANPFIDVPAKHWAYDAVDQIAKAGFVSGYGDATFRGDRPLTRYEMATVVAKAMAHSDKMDAETKAALEKLKAEFRSELNNLGVRVDNIERKLDNVKINGEARIAYKHIEDEGWIGTTNSNSLKLRSRIYFEGEINDQWAYTARLQNTKDLRNTSEDDDTKFNQAYVTGAVLGGVYQFGKQRNFVLDGLVVGDTFNGAAVAYKIGAVNAAARYGKEVGQSADDTYSGLELKAKAGVFNLGAAYHNIDSDIPADEKKIWEVSASTKLSPLFTLGGGYAQSDASTYNKAATLKLSYKEFDKTKAGSFSAWAQYRRTQANALYDSTSDVTSVNNGGAKAVEIGFDYAPWKNVVLETYYIHAKSDQNSAHKEKFFWTHLRYYF